MKTKTKNQGHSTGAVALLLLVAVVLACNKTGADETAQANKLVTEGNAAVHEAQKYVLEAGAKLDKMMKTPVAKLKEARVTAAEAIEAYDQAKGKCKEASKKFEEASKLKIKDKFKEYLTLKAKEFDKRAELVETAKGTPQALIDAKNRVSFVSVANANNERVDRLRKEADELAAQADKLQKDNPDSIK
jgi:hypothetical protein